jgi:mono/diheme cytochrome c family protein
VYHATVLRYLAGAAAVVILFLIVAFAAVWWGWVPAAADAPAASPLERWAAKRALKAAIARDEPRPPYPFGPPTDATIAAGAKLYMTNCAVCHGSAGSAASHAAMGLYVRAPQFTRHGVDDDPDGETYWKIEHGIRFTGMPSFKGALSEEQIWQIAYFLKRGTADLPPAAARMWNGTHGD